MIQKSSWTYYAYAFFPAMFWEEVYARKNSTAEGIRQLVAHLDSWSAYMGLGAKIVGFLVLLEAMVEFLSSL